MADMEFLKYCSSRVGKLFILNRKYVFYDYNGEHAGVFEPGTGFVLCKVIEESRSDWSGLDIKGELLLGALVGDTRFVLHVNWLLPEFNRPFDEAAEVL